MNQERLNQILFSVRTQVFVILDGALIPELRMKLYQMEPPHVCLYRGELEPDIAEVAPYLIKLGLDTNFTNWIMDECWGKNHGIFLHCPYSQVEVRRHFRSLLTVHDEDGNPMLFRFYDPRVFRTFLPTCNHAELEAFFGNVTNYFVEGEGKESIVNYSLEGGKLKTEDFDLK